MIFNSLPKLLRSKMSCTVRSCLKILLPVLP